MPKTRSAIATDMLQLTPRSRRGKSAVPMPSKFSSLSVEEYLAKEERATVRHEYVDGQMFAMSGVTPRHNRIAGNIYAILRAHVRGSHCSAYISDVKARVEATNSFYYPDVMVCCDKHDSESVFLDSPVLIVEVLSRSTSAIDRREKVIAYRQIGTLKEYLIVHQIRKRVELHRKNRDEHWEVLQFEEAGELSLESIPCGPLNLSIDAIYEDVKWAHGQKWEVHEETEEDYAEALDW